MESSVVLDDRVESSIVHILSRKREHEQFQNFSTVSVSKYGSERMNVKATLLSVSVLISQGNAACVIYVRYF